MTEKKLLFIVNPKAGKAQIKNHLLAITDVFIKAGYQVQTHITQSKGDAAAYVAGLTKDYDMIALSGGDGTLDEVVSGMMKSGKNYPLGYIPAGSTNDFANTLQLSKRMKDAAKDAVHGTPFFCDVGAFGEEVFVYVAAFGVFTEASYGTNQDIKNALGHAAYLLEGVKSLASVKAYPMRFSYGDKSIEGEFLFGMISNSESIGGFKYITGKDVALNDGQLEVTLIRKPPTLRELNKMLTDMSEQGWNFEQSRDNELVYTFKTDKLTIETDAEIAWTLDGEFGGNHKNVEIGVHKEAITIMVPQK